MTKKILFVSGGMAVLLFMGVGCAKKEVRVEFDAGFNAKPEVPETTECQGDKGQTVSCTKLMIQPPEDLTAEKKDALERRIVGEGAQVERLESVGTWIITLPAAADLHLWYEKLKAMPDAGNVYYDGVSYMMN